MHRRPRERFVGSIPMYRRKYCSIHQNHVAMYIDDLHDTRRTWVLLSLAQPAGFY